MVRVLTQEEVALAAGKRQAWKVELSYSTRYGRRVELAWYAVESPHTLLRYDDGAVNWLWASAP